MQRYDVAIVGGGMVGASLALALARSPLKVLLIESAAFGSHTQPSFDERTTALGNASRRIFEALGVWPAIAASASAIRAIHVSEAGQFGFARLNAREQGVEAFGYVAANRVIGAALWAQLGVAGTSLSLRVPATLEELEITEQSVVLRLAGAGDAETLEASLVVAADGAHSRVRRAAGIDAQVKEYEQVALVANVAAEQPHDGTAYERFTRSGPLALLPLHDGSYTAVWALAPAAADAVSALDDPAYLSRLQVQFGWRVGRFVRAGQRARYPLSLTRAAGAVGPRSVLIGNAAQALHPVAGQGFNLGLRDAAMLAETLTAASGDLGAPEVLADYARRRGADRRGVIGFTDGLIRLFGDARLPVGLGRNVGLLLFDLAPPAKRALARVSSGFGNHTPRLARGLPLW